MLASSASGDRLPDLRVYVEYISKKFTAGASRARAAPERARVSQLAFPQRLNLSASSLAGEPGESADQDRQESDCAYQRIVLPGAGDASKAIRMICPMSNKRASPIVFSDSTCVAPRDPKLARQFALLALKAGAFPWFAHDLIVSRR